MYCWTGSLIRNAGMKGFILCSGVKLHKKSGHLITVIHYKVKLHSSIYHLELSVSDTEQFDL